MKSGKLDIIEYSDLLNNEVFEIGWFPKRLEHSSIETVKCLSAYEIRIKDLEDNDEKYDSAVTQLESLFWELSEKYLRSTFLIAIEHKAFPKSRVRSLKGVFPYKGFIKKGEYIESEFEKEDGLSFFMGITPVTEDNKKECFMLAKDTMRSFWIGPKNNGEFLCTSNFLEKIQKYINVKGTNIIDYMRLIPALCGERNTVITFGQDARGDYINLRLFCVGKMDFGDVI
jgi:hypothetical protein